MKDNSSSSVLIPGIDGSTPLGFLAALGLLQVVDDHFRQDTSEPASVVTPSRPRLSWAKEDTWRPVLHGVDSLQALVDVLDRDRTAWADSPLLSFRYVKQEKQGPKAVGGLKAPLAVVRAWSRLRRDERDESTLAYGAALFCSEVTEVNKKPATAEDHASLGIAVDPSVPMELTVERNFLDLTARNAQFLEQVEIIRDYLSPVRIHAALESGKPDYDAPRTLDWDPSADTPGAIYTGFRRGFLPVHEWLGFRALRLFPLASAGSKVQMTSCTGRRLDGTFTWPLWEAPASLDAVASLIAHPALTGLTAEERHAFGISALFTAGLTKKADGYTGTLAPAQPN